MRSSAAVVDIGNSSIAVGRWSDGAVSRRVDFAQKRIVPAGKTLKSLAAEGEGGLHSAVVIASVLPAALDRLCRWIQDQMNIEPLVVGRNIPLPMEVNLPNPQAVGVDRICAAAAAYDITREPCVVVDFGTAITVDIVDSDGAFMGGSILPGLGMQARALHQHTAVLPEVVPQRPKDIVGRDTVDAIRGGVFYGTAGAIRYIVEVYATHVGRWPPVLATGGDANLIAEECVIFDSVVPDLCLTGVGLAYDKWLDDAVML